MENTKKTQYKKIAFIVVINILVLLYIEFGRTDEENYQRGVEAYQEQNYSKTYNIMSSLADDGHAGAQQLLATLYEEGQGVEVDESLASFWSEKAAKQEVQKAEDLTKNDAIPAD